MRLVDPSDAATAARRHRPLSSLASAGRLFVTGATVGPVVDSIHNRCLLQYDYAPINLEPFFHSSWIIPPLLGASYVILGMIVPRVVQRLILDSSSVQKNGISKTEEEPRLGVRAGQAVVSTILIIVLSLYLETTRTGGDGVTDPTIFGFIPSNSFTNVLILSLAALGQWSWLDQTRTSLVSALLAAFLGPLCELPLCAHGYWHYLSQACDYFPLEALLAGLHNNDEAAGVASTGAVDFVSNLVWGEDYDPRDLGLASITGPCYFAVTTDAIALGRWFDAQQQQQPPQSSSSSSTTIDAN
jgi:hypothetical protein